MTCKLNQLTQLHTTLCNADYGFSVLVEQRIDASGQAARRPADIALPTFDARGPLAVDFVVHHPEGLSLRRTEASSEASLKDAEDAKHREVEDFCHSHGWLFTAMGWNCWEVWAPAVRPF